MNGRRIKGQDDPAPTALPGMVACLGYGGLIPFIVTTFAARVDALHGPFWTRALICYGASIVSFLGALHWGFAMALPELAPRQRQALFAWSVVPALVAWIALLLPDARASVLLVSALAAQLWRDRCLVAAVTLPRWYWPLRLRLSGVAAACLLTVAIF